jgi:hypothetical protein
MHSQWVPLLTPDCRGQLIYTTGEVIKMSSSDVEARVDCTLHHDYLKAFRKFRPSNKIGKNQYGVIIKKTQDYIICSDDTLHLERSIK